jgi:hypothetical protein
MKRLFELDLRSLAAMRIALGALLLYDLVWRLRDIDLWYTDLGFLPRRLVVEEYWNPVWWCLHLYSGSTAGSAALLLLHALAALALAVGWRTRAASLLCWVLTLSLHNRNPLVIDAGDRLLLLLLMWGTVIPWEARFSLDARRSPEAWKGDDRGVLPGGVGYLLQMVQLYFLAGLWKIHPVWLTERTAMWRVFQLDEMTRAPGRWLLSYPLALEAISVGTVVLEVVGPLLLLAGNGRVRLLTTLAFAGLHLSIALTMDLEFFPLVSLAALIGLLPSLVWPRAEGDGLALAARWAVSLWVKGLAVLAVALTLAWNTIVVLQNRQLDWTHDRHPWLAQTAAGFRIVQFWDLFAPVPRNIDSRYLVEAKLSDGTTVDLLRQGRAYPVPRPELTHREFDDQRQRNYLSALEYSVGFPIRERYLRRLARLWNEQHPRRKVLWLRLLSERTDIDPGRPEPERYLVQLSWVTPAEPIWQGPVSPHPAPEPVGEKPDRERSRPGTEQTAQP